MKKTAYLSVALGLLVAGPVYAQSPLPTFDKEAVTEYPYNRRGEQQLRELGCGLKMLTILVPFAVIR